MVGTWKCSVLLRHDRGSTLKGIHAHSHRRILSLWFNALYTLYDTVFVLFFDFFFCWSTEIEVRSWFSSRCERGRGRGSEDDNVKLDDSVVPCVVFSSVSLSPPTVICLRSAAGPAKTLTSFSHCTDTDLPLAHYIFQQMILWCRILEMHWLVIVVLFFCFLFKGEFSRFFFSQ